MFRLSMLQPPSVTDSHSASLSTISPATNSNGRPRSYSHTLPTSRDGVKVQAVPVPAPRDGAVFLQRSKAALDQQLSAGLSPTASTLSDDNFSSPLPTRHYSSSSADAYPPAPVTPTPTTLSQNSSVASHLSELDHFPAPYDGHHSHHTSDEPDLMVVDGYTALQQHSPQWTEQVIERGQSWLHALRPDRLKQQYQLGAYAQLAREDGSINDWPIRKDLSRTYPTHPLFVNFNTQMQHMDAASENGGAPIIVNPGDSEIHSTEDPSGAGRPMLYNVLRAYASFDSGLGYAQGLAFIAGFLVQHIPLGEEAFWAMVTMMHDQQFNLRFMYINDCSGLQTMFSAFELMMQRHTARAYKHLQQQDVMPSMFSTQWFLTCFCYRVSYNFTAAVWDSLICDSKQIIGRGKARKTYRQSGYALLRLLQVATACIKYFEVYILTLQFEELIPFLSNPPELPEVLVNLSLTLAIPTSVQQLLRSVIHPPNEQQQTSPSQPTISTTERLDKLKLKPRNSVMHSTSAATPALSPDSSTYHAPSRLTTAARAVSYDSRRLHSNHDR